MEMLSTKKRQGGRMDEETDLQPKIKVDAEK